MDNIREWIKMIQWEDATVVRWGQRQDDSREECAGR